MFLEKKSRGLCQYIEGYWCDDIHHVAPQSKSFGIDLYDVGQDEYCEEEVKQFVDSLLFHYQNASLILNMNPVPLRLKP